MGKDSRRGAANVTVLQKHRRAIQELIAWGARNRRPFPWRSRRTAYHVLIAEKLLQQTAARQAVADAYQRLIAYCPNPARLAAADVRQLQKIVRPLGFVYRAKELKRLGKALNTQYQGRVPNDLRLLLDLPGVGDYAARAVLSFAFEKAVPIVDTNVARFLYRFFGFDSPISSNPARNKALLQLAAKIMPTGSSSAFNFAVLDLCASVCLPKTPKCEICPLRTACFTGQLRLGSP